MAFIIIAFSGFIAVVVSSIVLILTEKLSEALYFPPPFEGFLLEGLSESCSAAAFFKRYCAAAFLPALPGGGPLGGPRPARAPRGGGGREGGGGALFFLTSPSIYIW
eukprot:CAMPEP_0194672648 /NCGR_PEP_ID=MMETSP0295-20121207/6589_1 /TAXON_ID=39354 /ORGANISM="Heterosigma akashiwo, Strain CCMP2393" /LENGTH=106 /DNA_ID=CAMNT_0039556435 /DNA_START=194 /DNA_END=515 /DNA_ORIENTATION=-